MNMLFQRISSRNSRVGVLGYSSGKLFIFFWKNHPMEIIPLVVSMLGYIAMESAVKSFVPGGKIIFFF